MILCINANCPKPDNPQNNNNLHCQSCGSELLLEGRYRVMQLLSDNSGFGKIYIAEEQGICKILKVLKEHLNNNTKAVELFQKEAKVLAQLKHPGIPKVDRYFQYQTRKRLILHCIVMEKIEGLNLEEWLSSKPTNDVYNRFGDRVGWRINQRWLKYDDYNFTKNAPSGHLPLMFNDNKLPSNRLSVLAPKLAKCGIP